VEARGRLDTGEDRWADLLSGVAILAITKGDGTDSDTTLYWARAVGDAGRLVDIDLTRFNTGEKYRVAIDPRGAWECDCPDAVYRNRRCKHVSALTDALRSLGTVPAAAGAA
jgi:hypothetical protein